METPTTEDRVARMSRLMTLMIVGLAVLVAGISLVAFYMSFAVLRDLAVRSALPESVAWGLPVIIDGSIVAAILVILAWRMCGKRVVWPWIVLGVFSVVSIIGNGAHTAIAHDAEQGVPLWLAVAFGALPPIGLMCTCELLVRLPKAADIAAAVADPDGFLAQQEAPVEAVSTADSAVAEASDSTGPVDDTSDITEVPAPAVSSGVEPVAEAVAVEPTPVPTADDTVASTDDTGDAAVVYEADTADIIAEAGDSVVEADGKPSAPVTPLRRVLPDLATKAQRVDWLVEQKQAGVEISIKDLAEHFGVSERSVQRYATEADEKIEDLINTGTLEQAS